MAQTTMVDGRTGTEIAVAALARVLRGGADVHRCLAARALGALGGRAAVDALIVALRDEDEDVRADAAAALAAIGGEHVGATLLESLIGDPCGDVKLAAVAGLGRIGHQDAIPWLRRLVAGRDADIVWDEDEFFATGWDGWTDLQVASIGALAALSAEQAVPDITAALADENAQDLDEVAFAALAALGESGAASLTGYLDDANPRRRRRAAMALVSLGSAPAIGRALADADAGVRLAVARRAAAVDPSSPALDVLFTDPSPEVRAAAVRLLGCARPVPVSALLDDPSPEVQTEILTLLSDDVGAHPAAEIAAAARARLREAPARRADAAATALAAADPGGAAGDLAELLGDGAAPVEARLGALRALATIADERSIAAIGAAIGDEQRRLRLEAMALMATLADADPVWPNAAGTILLAALAGDLVATPDPAEPDPAEPDPAEPDPAEPDPVEKEDFDTEPQPEVAVAEVDEAAYPTSTLQSILNGSGAPGGATAPGPAIRLTDEDIAYLGLVHRGPGKRRLPPAPRIPAHEDVPRFAARVLGDVARADVARTLARTLDGDDDEIRLAAAESLARLTPRLAGLDADVVAALARAASDADRDLRLAAVRALGAAGDSAAVAVLERGLDDADGFVRAESVCALGALAALGAGSATRLLDDAEPNVRLAAARAVAKSGAADALDRLIGFAYADDGLHRREAARLLRALDGTAANARFVEALEDNDRLRLAPIAIEALEELNRPVPATV